MEVRAATADDIEGIVALQCDRNGAECDEPVRALLARADVGPSRFAVAVDGGRVVSSLCLLSGRLRIGVATVGTDQVEYVATATTHEGRGLVRRLMALAHEWSTADGNLVQLIAGIRYFYRQFGYEYALPFAPIRLVTPGLEPSMPAGWTVRTATDDDAADVARLQHDAQERADLAVVDERVAGFGDGSWSVAVDPDGRVRGSGRIGGGPPGVGEAVTVVHAPAADLPAALRAVLSRATGIQERVGTTEPVHGLTHRHPRHYSLYVRIADPLAFLAAIRPELDARLAGSPWAAAHGRVTISRYTSSIVLTFEDGAITAIEPGRGDEPSTIEVPPDRTTTLLLGRYRATGLAEREDDVTVAPTAAALADALFPSRTSDLSLL